MEAAESKQCISKQLAILGQTGNEICMLPVFNTVFNITDLETKGHLHFSWKNNFSSRTLNACY